MTRSHRRRRRFVKRQAFFAIAGTLFVDVLFNFGEPLMIKPTDVHKLLEEVGPERIVIGRRLDPREQTPVVDMIGNAEMEAFSSLFPRDELRWTAHHPRRRQSK